MTITFPDGPALTCEMALTTATSTYGRWGVDTWGSARWGPDDVFTDLSPYLLEFDSSRVMDRSTWAWQSGVGRLKFKNDDYRFSPDYGSSPYTVAGVSGLLPWRATRLLATYGGTTYPIFRMYTGDWEESLPTEAPTASVALRDEWAYLAGARAIGIPSTGAGDTFGARINRALDAAGHTGVRDVDTGTVTMQATTLSGTCTQELQLAGDSEGGQVWPDPEGTIVARRRYAILEEARSTTVQATFGTGAGEVSYADTRRDTTTDRIVNSVTWTRVGGAAQTVENPDSIARHGRRTAQPRTDLMCQTDAQVAALATWQLSRSATYQRSLESVTIYPSRDASMWPIALGLRERDLVQVLERRSWGTITRLCYVAGVQHQARAGLWRTTFPLVAAATLYSLSQSRWDIGTWGASATDTTGARWI